jgi:hypothetical protein
MTPAEADIPLTAADLLFGSSEDAPEALTRHIMSAGRGLVRAMERLPRVTREAAVREAAAAAAELLKVDLIEVLVSGWREHRDIYSAARRTLDTPGSKELVGLAPHRITIVQQPAVGILVDGHRVHTLQLGLSVLFDVTGLVAGIHAGRLAAVHSGRGEVGVALTVHEVEVLSKRHHLELPGVKAFKSGFRLLPASAYPDEAHAGHPDGLTVGGQVPGGLVASRFPGVDLLDSHGQTAAAKPRGTEHASQVPAAQHSSGQPAAEHPSSGETAHQSVPWWEKTRAQPTRPS